MGIMETGSFNALVEHFLGARLPRRFTANVSWQGLSDEAREFAVRMLALMKRASFPATEFNAHMMRLLFVVNPAMLLSAWGGRIPPLTAPGRHRKLDEYVMRHAWTSLSAQPVFIDMGCGFPPVTTADTARSIPDWSVIGVDRSFADFVLYDTEKNYACFDREGKYLYSQLLKKPLHDHPQAVRERFENLFTELAPHLKPLDGQAVEHAEKDGIRLIYNHVRNFESRNLKFIEADIEGLQLAPAQIVRCMNVLLYFEKSVRQKMRRSMGALLDDGGLLISGFNHPFGLYARYAVSKKDTTDIKPCEFAFSPDNLRPLGIGPWVTIADEDEEAELLADLTRAIRSDRRYWEEFDSYVDELRAQYGICRRGRDGFIQFTEEARSAPPDVIAAKTTALWNQLAAEGYTDGAVEALNRAGYQAWKNQVGDIAVLPPEGSIPPI